MTGTLNRVLLALAGLVLIVMGGSVLAIGLGADPPSWWIHDGKKDVLLSNADRHRWHDEGWYWWAVIAVLAVILLCALWWLASVLRKRRTAELLVDSRDHDSARLRGRALEDALRAEAQSYDGVGRAAVQLTGGREAPRARVRLRLAPHAAPAEILHRFSSEALGNACRSTGLAKLPAEIRLHSESHRPERVL